MNNIEQYSFDKSGWHVQEIITDGNGNQTIYAGKTSRPEDDGSGGCWCIRKITVVTANNVQIVTEQYADGDKNYDNVWNNHANLTYNYAL